MLQLKDTLDNELHISLTFILIHLFNLQNINEMLFWLFYLSSLFSLINCKIITNFKYKNIFLERKKFLYELDKLNFQKMDFILNSYSTIKKVDSRVMNANM